MAIRRERTKHRAQPIGHGAATGSHSHGGGHGSGGQAGPALGLQLDKRFGQHLLKNPGILDKIVSASDIKSSDTVLEIGPGTGNLTVRLLPLAKKVVALDIDPRMVAEVKKRCTSVGFTNLEAREGDALRSDFGKFDVCVANMPYQISSPFIFKILAHRPLWRCAVLMFQKEFAERLLAEPNEDNYGRLAINCRLFCKVTRVCKVAAGSFNPPPQVDSMVVKLVPRDPPLQVDFREWDGLMRICFGRKRKTLNALFNKPAVLNMLETNYKTWCSLNNTAPELVSFKDLVMGVIKELGLEQRRSISIDIDTYFQLLLAFNKRGVHFVNVAQTAQDGPKDSTWSGLDEYMFYDDDEKDDD